MKTILFLRATCLVLLILTIPSCNNSDDGGGTLAVIVTSVVDVITPISATCSGNITGDGGAAPTESGVCWSTEQVPDITDNKTSELAGAGEFSYLMTGLSPQTTYYARAYAINKAGTAYGEELSFTTPEDHSGETGTVTDIDGNVYQTIGIGSQFWTTENMKTTRFNDETEIPAVTDNSAWHSLAGPGYCYYINDPFYGEDFGALYNWYAIVSSKFPPEGWKVPTDADWTILETYLGGMSIAGGKLKETGTEHWMAPNFEATNVTGFDALAGGFRGTDGIYEKVIETANFWTSSSASNKEAWIRFMDYSTASNTRASNSVNFGLSVRLVKD